MERVYSEIELNEKINSVNQIQININNDSDEKPNSERSTFKGKDFKKTSCIDKIIENIAVENKNTDFKETAGDPEDPKSDNESGFLVKNLESGRDKIDSESDDNIIISSKSQRIKMRRTKLCGKFDKMFRKNNKDINSDSRSTTNSSSESESESSTLNESNIPSKNMQSLSASDEENFPKDHVSDERGENTKPPSPKGQRISAKQAMENMQKIKSEASRMLRTKDASLPYHRPSQISLRDIFATKMKKPSLSVTSDLLYTEVIESHLNIGITPQPKEIANKVICENDSDLPHVDLVAQDNGIMEISKNTEHSETIDIKTVDKLLDVSLDIGQKGCTEFIGESALEEHLSEDLIETLEIEDTKQVDHPIPDSSDSVSNLKPCLAAGQVIDLSGEIFREVPKKLTGVDLLRENFLKQQSLRTTAELERENDKKMKNRAFDLKQSLGEIIVQRRIQEWISRETETEVKKLEDEENDNKSYDGLPDEEHIDEAISDASTDTDSTSSSSDGDDNDDDGKVDEDLECSERKLNRVLKNADSSDECEMESEYKEISHSISSENRVALETSDKVAANEAEMTEFYDFHLRLDTETDDVLFSPNKTFIESPKLDSAVNDDGTVNMEKKSIEINQVQEFPIEESQTVDESQSRVIIDDSELMDLCTGKFVDGLVQGSPLMELTLSLSTSPRSSFTKSANGDDKQKKSNGLSHWLSSGSSTNKDRDNIDIFQPHIPLSDIINENPIGEDKDIGVRNQKGKLVIMSSDEESKEEIEEEEEADRESSVKKKKLLKRKDRTKAAKRLALQISDDDSSSSEDESDGVENAASIITARDKGEVEYDSEENEIATNERPKNLKAAEFFENEAELTSEDEWKGSGDEDEADLDTLEREEGDDDKFNERKMKKQLERIHMRQILDEDKREVRLLQEILLEDGDLNGRSRERKFKWKDFDWTADPSGNADEESGSQYLEELECEAIWRKQRHEREAYLRELKLKEMSTNGVVKDDLEDRVSHITSHTEVTAVAVNKTTLPSPKKDSLLIIKRTSATFSRASTSLSRLSALLESSSSNTDEILSKKVDGTSKNLVFAKSSPPVKCQDIMTKKRKPEEIITPESKKSCSSNNIRKVRRGLLDLIDL